mmetsp:Transcript_1607/g.2851  ORF Transcript_1607/g.2851 Transcript_1607/m.2851 type:complete len:167 (+) Transcript_1607:115-615(+)
MIHGAYMKVVKGKDQMTTFKCSEKAGNVRSYTTCCSTQLANAGGKFGPIALRPMMANTMQDAKSGVSFTRKAAARTMCGNANQEHVAAVPKDGVPCFKMAPWAMIFLMIKNVFLFFLQPGMGELAKDPVPWINGGTENVSAVVPLSAYQAMGHKLHAKADGEKKMM